MIPLFSHFSDLNLKGQKKKKKKTKLTHEKIKLIKGTSHFFPALHSKSNFPKLYHFEVEYYSNLAYLPKPSNPTMESTYYPNSQPSYYENKQLFGTPRRRNAHSPFPSPCEIPTTSYSPPLRQTVSSLRGFEGE